MWIVYAAGRVDWQHLAYVLPVALYLLVREVDWRRERVRPALLRAWAVAGTAAGVLLFWGVRWKDTPPSISAVMAVDADLLKSGVPILADLLPRARQEGLPILYLAEGGSALYFYWAPSPPPVDWLQPPSSRYNSPREYAAVARFAEEHEVPYVVTTAAYAEEFVRIGSPIGALLTKHYRQAMETPWGIAFERVRTAP
jgi:hypothetical protein